MEVDLPAEIDLFEAVFETEQDLRPDQPDEASSDESSWLSELGKEVLQVKEEINAEITQGMEEDTWT
eukprot:1677269-Amphidinium_carterae.1